MNNSATNHCKEYDLFGDRSFHFHDVRRCNIISQKSYEIHVNVSITIKVLGGVSFHVTVINWQQLKDTLGFSSFLGCLNQNRILLTRDLLPNISLVIG